MKKLLFILTLIVSNTSFAGGGIIDINQTCAGVSCMNGDALGFPVTITQPGSYRLTSNLVSTSTTTNVIRIESSNVTLDLNGFSIIGPRTCTGFGPGLILNCTNSGMTADGISGPNNVSGITIKNGVVRGFDTGIAILGNVAFSNMVINVIAENNEEGILIANGIITNSQANKNISRGFGSTISAAESGHLIVKDSVAFGNGVNSAVAHVCSNVVFTANGVPGITSDIECTNYTNGSVCKIASVCIQ